MYIFDVTKQPARPDTDGVSRPDMKLVGHDKEGFAPPPPPPSPISSESACDRPVASR